jgi:DNA-binding NarL/FixJ family response regulator
MEIKTVWLVEDHAAFRKSLVAVVEAEADLREVLGFGSIAEMLGALESGRVPDVLLMDLGLPGIPGLEGIERVRALAPNVPVVVLTVFDDDAKIFRAICAGARGYLLKTASAEEIVRAIRTVLEGGSPMNPRVARRVLERFNQMAPRKESVPLSERELEILKLLVGGMLKKQIAGQLELSIHTVDTYIRRIYEKMEVNTRSDAVAVAVRKGWV